MWECWSGARDLWCSSCDLVVASLPLTAPLRSVYTILVFCANFHSACNVIQFNSYGIIPPAHKPPGPFRPRRLITLWEYLALLTRSDWKWSLELGLSLCCDSLGPINVTDETCSQIWVGISAKYLGKFYTNIQILISVGLHLRWGDNDAGHPGLDNDMSRLHCLVICDEMGFC